MSFTYFLGPHCGIRIYEESNRDNWVRCQLRKQRINTVIYVAMMTLILVLIMCLPIGRPMQTVGIVTYLAATLLFVVWCEFIVPINSRTNYDRFVHAVDGLKKMGLSQEDAIKAMQQQDLNLLSNAAVITSSSSLPRF